MSLGASLQDIVVKECEFDRENLSIVQISACLQQVRIEESMSALLPFSSLHLSESVRIALRIQLQDFEALGDWHHILEFLRKRPISLYLDCTKGQWDQSDRLERLGQVILLDNVTVEGPLSAHRVNQN